jgi:hypothetical protein
MSPAERKQLIERLSAMQLPSLLDIQVEKRRRRTAERLRRAEQVARDAELARGMAALANLSPTGTRQ